MSSRASLCNGWGDEREAAIAIHSLEMQLDVTTLASSEPFEELICDTHFTEHSEVFPLPQTSNEINRTSANRDVRIESVREYNNFEQCNVLFNYKSQPR